jgi:hypothetical protein
MRLRSAGFEQSFTMVEVVENTLISAVSSAFKEIRGAEQNGLPP